MVRIKAVRLRWSFSGLVRAIIHLKDIDRDIRKALYFLREVSFFSGPALLGAYPRLWFLRELVLHDKHSSYDPSTTWYCRSQSETDRDNFLNPWEAKEYGLVSTVIDDGKPRLIAEGTNKDLPLE
ncbi:hypothetical protein F2Q70_00015584 [Brassica cretica]|uniref:ATP-dependent Clp protease proteolytic subunit n=1 Tax=Brassica cretica TaxID=69181 RepID=A0A8S9HQT9_BRACR|nr:hypothetical protein F2Q70_00015584 [Brassica cretica]